MSSLPEDTSQFQLFADEFSREDVAELIHLDCGDEPWSQAATQWIIGSDAWDSIRSRGTRVWLYRNEVDTVVGFGSLGETRRRWPPPDGSHSNFLFIPMLGIDRRFHGQPPDRRFRYSHQIVSHLRYEAIQQIRRHQETGRSTLPILSLLVHPKNIRAISLYEQFGFIIEPGATRADQLLMTQRIAVE